MAVESTAVAARSLNFVIVFLRYGDQAQPAVRKYVPPSHRCEVPSSISKASDFADGTGTQGLPSL
jgi:hypothetical protein